MKQAIQASRGALCGQNTPPRLALSIGESAQACGLSRATLYRLIQSGAIVPRKCGHRTLVPVAELERFLGSLPSGLERQ